MKNKQKTRYSTKVIVYAALFAAIAVVLGRITAIQIPPDQKYALDKFVIFMSGMFFGPIVGSLVGLVSDVCGALLFGTGLPLWYLCVPPVLYGLTGGLFRSMLKKKFTLPRLCFAYFLPIFLGSFLYQSFALSYMKGYTTFQQVAYAYLIPRGIQFSIMFVLEVALISILIKTDIFSRAGLWPSKKSKIIKEEKTMTVEQAIEYIHSVFWKGSIPGLSRTQELLKKMGNPEKDLKYVHIAGTNGKGSTAAMTASILQQAGYKVGLYTSPYIYRFHERMQVDGEQISDEDLIEITEYVKPLADSMAESPTEFELVCCIAFEYFKRKKCDIVVLEVGMGGEFDATNVIPAPEVAVITNIGLDHTDVLGSTVEEIALTKSGIFKEGGSAVVYRSTPSVEKVFEDVCKARNVSLKKADFDGLELQSLDLFGQTFHCGNRKNIRLPLLGDHQLHNASVVLSVADTLIENGWKITEENIYVGIRDVSWPGRFDIVCRDPLFIIDGGHNPQCIEALVKNMEDYLKDRKVIALTGVLADKDYGDMYKPMMPLISDFVCITPDNPRKMEAADLAKHLQSNGAKATACATTAEGVRKAMELAGKDGAILCFGSLYSIGSIHQALMEIL